MSPSNTVEAVVPDCLLSVKRYGPRKPFCSPGKEPHVQEESLVRTL